MVFNTIGSFLNRIKDSIEIQDNIEYKRVTIKTNHKGVKLRNKALGSTIGTKKQFKIKGGDFILSKIDARYGAFGIIPENLDGAIITGNFWTYEVNTKLVDIEWFFYFTHSFEFIRICKESSTGTTHRKYLNEKFFLEHKIYLPDKSVQTQLVKSYKEISKKGDVLNSEIQSEKQLITQLKQAILQEAIQGKLTQEWREQNPNTEPASELLERIKAEKKQLINYKKIRKEKPLPSITEDETPFKIPENWTWCRLGQITTLKGGKRVSNGYKLLKYRTNHIYIRVTDMKNGTISENDIHYIDNDMYEKIKNYTISKNDLYITIAGTIGEVGVVPERFDNMNLTENAAKFVFNNSLINKYWLKYFLISNFCQKQFSKKTKKKTAQPKLALSRIKTSLLPIPPLDEQKAIVGKVKSLMQKCKKVELEIIQNEQHANMLKQAVLNEAFQN